MYLITSVVCYPKELQESYDCGGRKEYLPLLAELTSSRGSQPTFFSKMLDNFFICWRRCGGRNRRISVPIITARGKRHLTKHLVGDVPFCGDLHHLHLDRPRYSRPHLSTDHFHHRSAAGCGPNEERPGEKLASDDGPWMYHKC